MLIPDPGSRILDPKTATKERVEKNLLSNLFLYHKFHKIVNYFIFEMLKKKFGPIFKELYNFLFKTLPLSSQKYGFGIRDPRPGIRKKPILDPGSRGQKGTGSRIRTCNTGL
jgi:hypothetical protein